jgi:SagB-type dehydrogenase family enzyme
MEVIKPKRFTPFLKMLKNTKKIYDLSRPERQKQFQLIGGAKASEYFGQTFYKVYPRFKQIPLNVKSKEYDLETAQKRRRSIRKFSKIKKISFEELSSVIYFSSAVNHLVSKRKLDKFLSGKSYRMHESAGGQYPIEVYLAISGINLLEEGIYHYNVLDNTFEFLKPCNVKNFLKFVSPKQINWIGSVQIGIILTAVPLRQEIKYGSTAFRFLLKEAGAKTHALGLHSTKLDIGYCEIGAFEDQIISKELDLDSDEELIISLIALGKRR